MSGSRTATCRCGALAIECAGEPVRVSVCHCLNCQKRSGSAFAVQARFPHERVRVTGEARTWVGHGGSGAAATFSFCPTCGSTVFYVADQMPDLVAVAVGAFAEPGFPPPIYSVYEGRRHSWVTVAADGMEHYD